MVLCVNIAVVALGSVLVVKSCSGETDAPPPDSLEIISYDDADANREIAKVLIDVQPGETVDDIAKEYFGKIPRDIALDSIRTTNGLGEDAELAEGQQIKIYITQFDELSLSPSSNPVIEDVANLTDCDESLIAAANQVKTNEKLSGEIRLPRQAAPPENASLAVIKPGNTYYGLSQDHGVNVADTLAFNPMDAQLLQPGQIAVIPSATDGAPAEVADDNVETGQDILTDFISKYEALAEMVEAEYGVPADLVLAQASKESDFGRDVLATEAHNFFGIKAKDGWDGGVYYKSTIEYVDGEPQEVEGAFRVYDSEEAGFRGFGEKLHEKYYDDAFGLTDPHEFFARMVDDNGPKYATDPEYLKIIDSRISEVEQIRHPETDRLPGPAPAEIDQSSTVAERIAAVELSPEGYRKFVDNIDESVMGYAKKYSNFDGTRDITDRGTKMFIWHYTSLYLNGEGSGHSTDAAFENPDNTAYPKHLATSMYNAGGTGIQYFIDRDGKTWRMTDKKAWHCYSVSEFSEGVEIESTNQDNITTKQYEAAAYLAAYDILKYDMLSNGYGLEDVLIGHNVINDSQIVKDDGGSRNTAPDFTAEPTKLLRAKVDELLTELG
jgi:flagellum-specific peptidoglycan hydrolase FlgJ